MDKIIIKNIAFYGYHGVLPEERKLGQRFFADLTLFIDLEKAAKLDSINETVDYAEAFKTIEEEGEKNQFKLIETLAEKIIKALFTKYKKVIKILLRIKKLSAPIPGQFDYVAVEMERERSYVISNE